MVRCDGCRRQPRAADGSHAPPFESTEAVRRPMPVRIYFLVKTWVRRQSGEGRAAGLQARIAEIIQQALACIVAEPLGSARSAGRGIRWRSLEKWLPTIDNLSCDALRSTITRVDMRGEGGI